MAMPTKSPADIALFFRLCGFITVALRVQIPGNMPFMRMMGTWLFLHRGVAVAMLIQVTRGMPFVVMVCAWLYFGLVRGS